MYLNGRKNYSGSEMSGGITKNEEWSKFWLQPCYKVRKPNGSWNGIRGVKVALFEPITNPKDLSLTGPYQGTTQTPLNGMTQMEDDS